MLGENPATVLIPDILVICREDVLRNRKEGRDKGKYYGGPRLVAEVLSPSTRRRDTGIKHAKYLEGGVKEYWIVDPGSRKVIVYDLQSCREENSQADLCYLYGPDQKVPVLISEGSCEVDFPEIWRTMDSFMGTE